MMNHQPGTNRPVWSITKTNPELSAKLQVGLKEVVDPEIGFDVITLGLIRDIEKNEDGGLDIKLILTSPFCPYAPMMIDMVRNKAEDISQETCKVELNMEVWDISMMEEGAAEDLDFY